MAKAEIQQWQDLGEQAKKAQKELHTLLSISNKTKVPKSISQKIAKAMDGIQDYKYLAEDRMFKEHPSLDDEALNIFYGEEKELKK